MMAFASTLVRLAKHNNLLQPGINNLKSYLRSELPVLRQKPVLLISSEAAVDQPFLKPVADSCQWVNFLLLQQLALRVIPTHISAAVPTKDDLEKALQMMHRTGSSAVVAVGSGAAVDLGKAVARAKLDETMTSSDSDNDAVSNKKIPLLLIPTTYSGIVASGSSHSLFLGAGDDDNDTLLPFPQQQPELANNNNNIATISTLEPQKYMEPINAAKLDTLLLAISTILIDASLRSNNHPTLPTLLQETIDLVALRESIDQEQNIAALISPSLIRLLYDSAGLLSFGEGNDENRSIPIALASSVLPTIFPTTHPLSFFAGLYPGMCHVYTNNDANFTSTENNSVETLVHQLRDTISSSTKLSPPPSLRVHEKSLEGFSLPDMSLPYIHGNQRLWDQPKDYNDDVLVQVLLSSTTTKR